MNAHTAMHSLSALDALGQRLFPGQARRVGHGAGELTVLTGRVWLTGQGEQEDRVVGAGERVRLDAADAFVIEALDRTQPASVAWQPRGAGFGHFSLRDFFGASFDALARKAASKASRAQGSMS